MMVSCHVLKNNFHPGENLMKIRPFNFLMLLLLLLLIGLPAMSSAESRMPPPDYPLLEAVKSGDVEKVKSILGENPSSVSKYEINQKGHTGDTPLTVAASKGNLEIVKLLVEHGAVVDAGKEAGDRTPLIEAAGHAHADVVQYLIAKGADVQTKGKGLTPLLAAFAWGNLRLGPAGDKEKTIRILLENGADVNVQDESWLKTGRTPLMYAVLQGDAALVQTFLAKGARLDLKNKDGETALSLAKKDGLEYIAQLLEKAAGGSAPAQQSDLSSHPLIKAVKEGRLDQVQALIAKGADANLRTPSGSTPLMYAADGNFPEVVRYLLKNGADINAKNGSNNTALIYAAIKGHAGVVQELLKKKADVHVKNMAKGDALIYAVMGKKTEVVSALLKHGARVNDRYDDGKTALMMAIEAGSSDIARLLLIHKADANAVDKDEMTALIIACEKGNADMVEALLKAGADVNKKSKYGDTALSKAIAAHHVRIVRTLVRSGTFDRREALFSAVIAGDLEIVQILLTKDMDVNMRGFASGTALMLAADGDIAIVKYLVERGADVNLKDDEGNTALMKAVLSFNNTNIASLKYLIACGADVNAINNKGETALILAVKRGNEEMVGILVAKGCAVSPKDKLGKSAWTYAVEGAKPALVGFLEKAGASRDYKDMEWKGNGSKQKVAFIKVVETQSEWTELWSRALEKPAPEMDFERYVVACVFLGYAADWLYSIGFGEPVIRDNQRVIPYGLYEVMLKMSGPFKAGGQYHMKVFEKKKDVKMILEEADRSSRRR
jgi:ankyrin repeat protein